jgi:hypothetical protein
MTKASTREVVHGRFFMAGRAVCGTNYQHENPIGFARARAREPWIRFFGLLRRSIIGDHSDSFNFSFRYFM